MRCPLTLALLLVVSATSAQEQSLVICDFDEHTTPWRSKFDRLEVVEAGGDAGNALRYAFDLSQEPNYDWIRAQVETGVDVRDFRYLSFRIRAEAGGERLTPMLIRRVEPSPEHPQGEIVASASRHYVTLDFEGWRTISVPLEAFAGLDEIASDINEFNFSLRASGIDPAESTLWIDDLALSVEPRGEVLAEQVPFPPAEIAIEDEAEFFSLLDLEHEGLAAVRNAVEAEDWEAAKEAWFEHLKTRRAPRWTWSRDDREAIMALEEELFGGMERHVPSAERVLAREFNILGVPKTLERDVQWLQGPVEWTHVLSRHAYWKTLGYAWWATGDDKYAEEFVAQ
ncbi:MAG: heparinase II/III family protein, partial [Armatimonadota bacterium]